MEPMEIAYGNLSHLARQARIEAELTYRLKRATTIFEKLKRESGLELDRMHDFGGCRAVVTGRDALSELRDAVEDAFIVKRTYDYVENPRSSGYRAIHVIVSVNSKLIEIQLRTRPMHKWAETAEAFSARLGQNFKQDGEHKVQQLLWALAEQSNSNELGNAIDPGISARISGLIPEVLRLLDASDQLATRGDENEHDQ